MAWSLVYLFRCTIWSTGFHRYAWRSSVSMGHLGKPTLLAKQYGWMLSLIISSGNFSALSPLRWLGISGFLLSRNMVWVFTLVADSFELVFCFDQSISILARSTCLPSRWVRGALLFPSRPSSTFFLAAGWGLSSHYSFSANYGDG